MPKLEIWQDKDPDWYCVGRPKGKPFLTTAYYKYFNIHSDWLSEMVSDEDWWFISENDQWPVEIEIPLFKIERED